MARYNFMQKCRGCKGMTFVPEDDNMCPDCRDDKDTFETGNGRNKGLGIVTTRWEIDKLIKNLPDNEKEG